MTTTFLLTTTAAASTMPASTMAASAAATTALTESSCLFITFSMAGIFAVLSFGALLFAARVAGRKNQMSVDDAEPTASSTK